jgi:NPCBM/NEW2 domain-containing protein
VAGAMIASYSPSNSTSEPLLFPRGRTGILNNVASAAAIALCLSLVVARSDAAGEVTATTLEGATVSGKLSSWEPSQIVIGTQVIPTEKLMSLHWTAAKTKIPVAADTYAGQVCELIDGSQIPITNVRVHHAAKLEDNLAAKVEKALLQLAVPVASTETTTNIAVHTKYVADFRLKPLNETLAKQWNEIRKLKLPDDVLVVIKRDGTSLDYIEGVLGEITDDRIEFKIDGEPNRVDRAKVAGVIYSRPNQARQSAPRFNLRGNSGLSAGVVEVQMQKDGFVTLTTPSGASFRWPLDDLEAADYSSDKVMYLSDIDPASQSWSPLVGLPAGVTLAAQYGEPRRNHSAFGDSLSLQVKDKNSQPGQPGVVRSFDKGLALRSHTELVYRFPEGFNRFIALAGIEPATASTGNVRLTLLADDHSIFDAEIAGDESPQSIDVPIVGVKRLKIIVDFGQNLDTGDWLNLCDAKITK